jgi:phosphoglycolate phosphatase-like HAD superfamily hydrolase
MVADSPMNILVIFDLDGTLINVFDYHVACLDKVIKTVWAIPNKLPVRQRFGVPQRETLRRICDIGGIPSNEIVQEIPYALQMLASEMQLTLPKDLGENLLPGAIALLNEIAEMSTLYLALATGTIKATAETLLTRSGLKPYFPVGAFGDECHSRQELVRLARDRALHFYNLDKTQTTVVTIGDAPSDIEAGKSIGARTVAVTTGSLTFEELDQFCPDVILESLQDADFTLRQILGSS